MWNSAWVLAAWPMVCSPVLLIELGVCFAIGRPQCWRYFAILVGLSLGSMLLLATFPLLDDGDSNQLAIWSTTGGHILHPHALRPRAWLPRTAVVRVKAAALNPSDYRVYAYLVNAPFARWACPQSPAFDLVGEVVESNCPPEEEGYSAIRPGQLVFGNGMGALQQYALVLCNRAGRVPASPSPDAAPATAAASVTVMYTAMTALRHLPPADASSSVVVILGASGGCGQATIALARRRGVRHIVCVASRPSSLDMLRRKGCTQVYDYRAPEGVSAQVLREWKGRANVVLDTHSSLWNGQDYVRDLYWGGLLSSTGGRYVVLSPVWESLAAAAWRSNTTFETLSAAVDPHAVRWLEHEPGLLFDAVDVSVVLPDAFNLTQVAHAFGLLHSRARLLHQHGPGRVVLRIPQ